MFLRALCGYSPGCRGWVCFPCWGCPPVSALQPGLKLQLQLGDSPECSHGPSPGCSWRALAQLTSHPGLRKAGGCHSLWGQAGLSLLLSPLSPCLSIQHPLHIPHQRMHQCLKEQWVTKGRLKHKERKDGIWDLAHMWVWVTPFFFTQEKRSPCLHPPGYLASSPGCNSTNNTHSSTV